MGTARDRHSFQKRRSKGLTPGSNPSGINFKLKIPLFIIYSFVFSFQAVDLDSGKYGQIEYRFVKDDHQGATNFFYIDPVSGLIRTTSTFDSVQEIDLPFRLIVEARDNPKGADAESKKAEADVVVSTLEIL